MLSQLIFSMKVKVKLLGRVTLFVLPWTIQSMEFSRPEYWRGQPFPSPGDLPNPGINPGFPHCRQILYQLGYQEVIYRMLTKSHKQKLHQEFKRMRILDLGILQNVLWEKQNPLFRVFTDCQLQVKHSCKTQAEGGRQKTPVVKEMKIL